MAPKSQVINKDLKSDKLISYEIIRNSGLGMNIEIAANLYRCMNELHNRGSNENEKLILKFAHDKLEQILNAQLEILLRDIQYRKDMA